MKRILFGQLSAHARRPANLSRDQKKLREKELELKNQKEKIIQEKEDQIKVKTEAFIKELGLIEKKKNMAISYLTDIITNIE